MTQISSEMPTFGTYCNLQCVTWRTQKLFGSPGSARESSKDEAPKTHQEASGLSKPLQGLRTYEGIPSIGPLTQDLETVIWFWMLVVPREG